MLRNFKQFVQYSTWNIVIPIAVPILGIILVVGVLKGNQLSFGVVFGRPDMLLITTLLSGETYAEMQSFNSPTGIAKVVWIISSYTLPVICVLAALLYGVALYDISLQGLSGLSIFSICTMLFSIFLAIFSWFCFNKQRMSETNRHHANTDCHQD